MAKQMVNGGKSSAGLEKFEKADAKQDKALLGKLKAAKRPAAAKGKK